MSNMRVWIYRLLTIVWLGLFMVAIQFGSSGRFTEAGVVLGVVLALIIGQALMLKCPACGIRPGILSLVFWSLFLDPACYIADVLLVKECPRCGKPFIKNKLL